MKNFCTVVVGLLATVYSWSQTLVINPLDCGLTYGYDAAGNRVTRLRVACGFSSKMDETDSSNYQPSEHGQQDTLFSEIEVSVFPNPTSGKFMLDFTQYLEFIQVIVVSNTGQVMLDQKTAGQQIPIDISNLSAGLYYIKLYTTKKEFAKIVVKK